MGGRLPLVLGQQDGVGWTPGRQSADYRSSSAISGLPSGAVPARRRLSFSLQLLCLEAFEQGPSSFPLPCHLARRCIPGTGCMRVFTCILCEDTLGSHSCNGPWCVPAGASLSLGPPASVPACVSPAFARCHRPPLGPPGLARSVRHAFCISRFHSHSS